MYFKSEALKSIDFLSFPYAFFFFVYYFVYCVFFLAGPGFSRGESKLFSITRSTKYGRRCCSLFWPLSPYYLLFRYSRQSIDCFCLLLLLSLFALIPAFYFLFLFLFLSLFRKAHKYNCLLVCFFNSRTQVLFFSLSTLEFDICTNVLKREDLAINPLNSANYCIGYYGSFFYTQISSFFQPLCVYVCRILFFVFYKCEMHFLWSHMYFSSFCFWFVSLKLH